ncbi:winged helix-turn-helix domain-containing protein [Serratia fonticola]|uniref:winged helix-turn-helix domain-containing protein n=1 Tax=Serratia fonticola TaxID=47917 RepID=UPI0016495C5E|nr:winged helix-turn-helix domain-containing protein [Serratia fonticola]MBC3216853.1 winged helix-turn-helix transcriptional regulator [Serratia fonticola]MBC3228191.1 winged helix-turn-helix transcriptional regulator [Serratia fonticola]
MKYTINLIIVFDPEHRTLALNNNNQTALELSKPSCRVLNEFIKNNGVNLSRDSLLKNAWEDYGFPASNAGLNNCISELRKSFVSLGIEKPIIITLPKIGFRMEADIHPTPKQKIDAKIKKVEQVVTKPEKEGVLKEEKSIGTLPLVMPGILTIKTMMIPTLALLIVLGFIGLALLLRAPSTQLKLISTYKQCDIYSIRKDPVPGSELRAKKILESEKLGCDRVRQDIFYTEERPDNELLKITFLAACQKDQTAGDYQHCKTFKINE